MHEPFGDRILRRERSIAVRHARETHSVGKLTDIADGAYEVAYVGNAVVPENKPYIGEILADERGKVLEKPFGRVDIPFVIHSEKVVEPDRRIGKAVLFGDFLDPLDVIYK